MTIVLGLIALAQAVDAVALYCLDGIASTDPVVKALYGELKIPQLVLAKAAPLLAALMAASAMGNWGLVVGIPMLLLSGYVAYRNVEEAWL